MDFCDKLNIARLFEMEKRGEFISQNCKAFNQEVWSVIFIYVSLKSIQTCKHISVEDTETVKCARLKLNWISNNMWIHWLEPQIIDGIEYFRLEKKVRWIVLQNNYKI